MEKQEALFTKWLSPPAIEFASPQAEKAYKERITRIKDAVQLKKLPDRVPVYIIHGFFPAYYAGITPEEAMYDYDKLSMAWKKYVLDFEPDAHFTGCLVPGPGRLFDILDYKLYAWPGHGVSPNHTYQCLEGEYMKVMKTSVRGMDRMSLMTSKGTPPKPKGSTKKTEGASLAPTPDS